jgi:hypothetical protein
VVIANGKLIFMAPSQSPNCTTGRILVCDEARSSESRTTSLLAPWYITMSRLVLWWTDQHILSGSYSLAGSCLFPRPLSPAPPDIEDSPELPQLLSPTLPSTVEDYLAIRTLPHMTSRQVCNQNDERTSIVDGLAHSRHKSPASHRCRKLSSTMDRWIEDVRFHGFHSVDMLTISCALVHLIPRKRILLRDRRGVPNRPFQSHWPQH